MSKSKCFILFIVILNLSSCVRLTKQGAQVRLVDGYASIPESCKEIGHIKEEGFDQNMGKAHLEARYDLRNRAAKQGANLVKVTEETESFFPRGWYIQGMAYKCDFSKKVTPKVEQTLSEKCKAKGGQLNNGQCILSL